MILWSETVRCGSRLRAVFGIMVVLLATIGVRANTGELEQLTARIDMDLYEQSKKDIRNWLDDMLERYGEFGVFPDQTGRRVQFREDDVRVSFNEGWAAEAPAMFFRAYEMLGEEKYLEAALGFCDFLLKAQQPAGHFPGDATVHKDGSVSADDNTVRLQDRYQYPYFALLLYAYRMTGEEKYREAAVKNGEMIFSIQNPLADDFWMGAWPDEVPVRFLSEGSPKETIAGGGGVSTGYSHNDYATYDAYRTMVMMYHLTGDEKYIRRIERLPQWIFDGQLGFGNVRGWTEEYGAHNEPVWARRFESTLIDPRNLNRFVGPMLIQFYAITGNPAYRNLFQESLHWLKSMEHPPEKEPKDGELLRGDFAHKYTYDGREAWSARDEDFNRIDYRDRLAPGETHKDHIPTHGGNVHLENMEKVYGLIQSEGLAGLRAWFGPKPVEYDEQDYLQARIEAARRVTDEEREVVLQVLPDEGNYQHERRMGHFLERVRRRLVHPENAPQRSPVRRMSGGARDVAHSLQIWRPSPGRSPYKPQYGWATWQFVWDVRLALGKIDAATAARGGRGLEAEGSPTTFFEPWDVRGDWTMHALEVENWLDIPFRDDPIPVNRVVLTPETIALQPEEEQRIDVIVQPRSASYRTVIWQSDDPAIATVEPRMIDEIDPEVRRPVYLTEGKMMVIAHAPGQTRITVRSTCGSHTASAVVIVSEE